MKYTVTGTYTITENVDTDTPSFRKFVEMKSIFHGGLTEDEFVEEYAKHMASYSITGDDGRGNLGVESLDWTVSKVTK